MHRLRHLSELALGTCHLLQVETWLTCGQPPQTPSMPSVYRKSPAKRSQSGGGAPGSGASGSGALGAAGGISGCTSRALLKCFFFFVFYPEFPKFHLARRSALLSSAQLRSQLLCSAQLCSAAQRSAVRCHALPCDAVLDRAAPWCVHTRYRTKVPGTRVCT